MTAPRPSSARTSAASAGSGENVFHPEALASAHHYGFSLRLCKAYRPQTKGKVESDVPYVRERLLRAHGFASYEHANRAWASWNEDVARRRVHGTHGEVVAVRAERDRAALGTAAADALPGRRAHHPRRRARRAVQLRGPPLRRPGRAARRARRARPRRRGDRDLLHRRRAPARAPRARPAREGPARPGRAVGVAGAGARRAPGARGASPAVVGLPGAHRWLS